MLLRWLLPLSMILAAVTGSSPARASCAPRTPRHYFQQAQLVFVGRAGATQVRGGRSRQTIQVLHALKGNPGEVFLRVRPAGVKAPNQRDYAPGEVALFFVNRGEVALCAGNFPLAAQMDQMDQYLALQSGRADSPPLAVFARVVQQLLQPYLHARPHIPVTHRALAGQALTEGKSKLTFVRERRKDAVEITQALSRGRLHLITGRYPVEGLLFRALLLSGQGEGKDQVVVLYQDSRER